MASRVSYLGDGSNRAFNIIFPYANASEIGLTVNEVSVPFTFSTPSLLVATSPPAAGSHVTIYRNTSIDFPATVFEDTAVLTEKDLNRQTSQFLYKLQEEQDNVTALTNRSLRTPVGVNNPELIPISAESSLITIAPSGAAVLLPLSSISPPSAEGDLIGGAWDAALTEQPFIGGAWL